MTLMPMSLRLADKDQARGPVVHLGLMRRVEVEQRHKILKLSKGYAVLPQHLIQGVTIICMA